MTARIVRGIAEDNPLCGCKMTSRRQVGVDDRAYPWSIHYCCAVGRCHYFEYERDPEGGLVILPPGDYTPEQMIKLGL